MKSIPALLLVVLCSAFQDPAAPPPTDAEGWFKRMSDELKDAETLSCDFTFTRESNEPEALVEGSFKLKDRGKVRIGVTVKVGEEEGEAQIISNGKTLTSTALGSGKDQRKDRAVPDGYEEFADALLSRAGIAALAEATYDLLEYSDSKEIESPFTSATFKLGSRETLAGREVQELSYILEKSGKTEGRVTLWIDTKSFLPAKRHFISDNDPDASEETSVETYTNWQLNAEIEDKEFEVE